MSLVILGRNGVINGTEPIQTANEWTALPGSLEAIKRLSRSGYRVAVVSNQPEIALKTLTIDELNEIHKTMVTQLKQLGGSIEVIFFCPHNPKRDCKCRKPEPGMLLNIASRLHLPLKNTYCVGDSQCDIDAAAAAGAKPVLVKTGNGATLHASGTVDENIPVYENLAEFTDSLLEHAF